jgi:glycosyltransferase involved in cell wall biosynthesis
MRDTTGVPSATDGGFDLRESRGEQAQAGRRHDDASLVNLSFVIPAYNEGENIARVLETIPHGALAEKGWTAEVLLVDNRSTDDTAKLARRHGARVVLQAARGYGNAYMAGFASARGEMIITGDADCTYPFDAAPDLLDYFQARDLDFLSTYRLGRDNRAAMKPSHAAGNHLLTLASRALFGSPFRDSQSGMWVFRRAIWPHLDVRSAGMAFSQEIKNEAYLRGFSCAEVPIEYRTRGGDVKLSAARDGIRNASQMFAHRARTVPSSSAIAQVS